MSGFNTNCFLRVFLVTSLVVAQVSALEDPNRDEEFQGTYEGKLLENAQRLGVQVLQGISTVARAIDSSLKADGDNFDRTSQSLKSKSIPASAQDGSTSLSLPLSPKGTNTSTDNPGTGIGAGSDPITPAGTDAGASDTPSTGGLVGSGSSKPQAGESYFQRMAAHLPEANKRNIGITAVAVVGVGATALWLKKDKEKSGLSWGAYLKAKLPKMSRRNVGIVIGTALTAGILSQLKVERHDDGEVSVAFPGMSFSWSGSFRNDHDCESCA